MTLQELIRELSSAHFSKEINANLMALRLKNLDTHKPVSAEAKAPSGPGKASFPCPSKNCNGKLLNLAVAGVLPSTGKYTRYRKCNTCGKRYKTEEYVFEVMK